MRSFPIAALVAGASLLALSQAAVGQTGEGVPTPQARPLAQTISVQPTRSRPVLRRTADMRLARVQAWRAPASCSSFACGRLILLGIAY